MRILYLFYNTTRELLQPYYIFNQHNFDQIEKLLYSYIYLIHTELLTNNNSNILYCHKYDTNK